MLNAGSTSVWNPGLLPKRSAFPGHNAETQVFLTKLTFLAKCNSGTSHPKMSRTFLLWEEPPPNPADPIPVSGLRFYRANQKTDCSKNTTPTNAPRDCRCFIRQETNRWPPNRANHKPAVLSCGKDDVQRSYLRRTFQREEPSCSRHDNMQALVKVWRPLIISNLTAESWPTGTHRYLYGASNTNTQLPIYR